MTEKPTYMYLPSGEWGPSLESAINKAGLEMKPKDPKSLRFELMKIPIIFQLCRPNDVLTNIDDADTLAIAGFTGSDVLAEQKQAGITPQTIVFDQDEIPGIEYTTWNVPLANLVDKSPKPSVVLGATRRLTDQVAQPTVSDMRGGSIYTSYPEITKRFFYRRGLNQIPVTIKYRAGKIEGADITDPTALGIVDIVDTGLTGVANGITPVESIMVATLMLVVANNIPSDSCKNDLQRIADLQEILHVAANKNKKA